MAVAITDLPVNTATIAQRSEQRRQAQRRQRLITINGDVDNAREADRQTRHEPRASLTAEQRQHHQQQQQQRDRRRKKVAKCLTQESLHIAPAVKLAEMSEDH